MKFVAKQKNILLLLVLAGLFFVFAYANALQTNWPPSPIIGTSLDQDSTLPTLIKYFYEWGISLGGLAAFISLIIAGIQYLTSMGDPTKMKESFDRISSAFFGIILLLSSLLILNTINPDLTSLRKEPFNPDLVPHIENLPDLPDLENVATKCEKIEVLYDGGKITLSENICSGELPVPATKLISSQAFIINDKGEEKAVDVCQGNLQFYEKSNCTREIGTILPPTNKKLNVTEEAIKAVRFVLP